MLVECLMRTDRAPQALALAESLDAALVAEHGSTSERRFAVLLTRSGLLARLDRGAEADAAFEQARGLARSKRKSIYDSRVRQLLALASSVAADATRAERVLRAAWDELNAAPGAHRELRAACSAALVEHYERVGAPELAAPYR